MIDKLKTFVSKHKQEFDSAEPGQDLWKKIDAKLEMKNSSAISSKWLSKLKYFGLSASVLMIAVYFITQKLNNSSSNELAQNIKDSALNNSGQWIKSNQNKSEIGEAGNNSANAENGKDNKEASSNKEENSVLNGANVEDTKRDSVYVKAVENISSEQSKIKPEEVVQLKEEEKSIVVNESKPIRNNKKVKIQVPAEAEKNNSYSGTLYDNSSLCEVLRAYKFPGQVSLDASSNYTTHRTLKTLSCSRLAKNTNVKAVWLKGKTSKKVTVAIKEGFKNILLIKSDGREVSPEAISHYYNGLGVISGYTGKHFDMIFKDKVELILFFSDVEEGDKISVDGIIEAVVSKP
ncbi:MAG: hypothetical protein KA163_09515 [Bacteroidia bacterium]|nr:hypothetical protein [Bacteroidia bacterium]